MPCILVQELYSSIDVRHIMVCRYRKQTKRWQDYIRLFGFLIFVALFLAVLFLQRNAQVAYQASQF